MPDSVIRLISRSASTILDPLSLAELMKSQWAFFELLGLEVFEVVRLAKQDVDSNHRKDVSKRNS